MNFYFNNIISNIKNDPIKIKIIKEYFKENLNNNDIK